MSKLIYVDRLKKDILALQDCYNGFSDTYDKACIIGVIDEQPTIEDRKKGKWLPDNNNYYEERFICSVCGKSYKVDTCMGKPMWDFCPCGADMRKTCRKKVKSDE